MDKKKSFIILTLFSISLILLSSCGKAEETNVEYEDNKAVRIGYIGEIYEAPLFIAEKNGNFSGSNLNVELVKFNDESLKKELIAGTIDGITGDSRLFQYLDQGIDYKLVLGLHSGCMEIITSKNSDIKDLKALKGKTIGIQLQGSGPMVVFSSLIRKNGVDPVKEIKWKVLKEDSFKEALEKKEIDAGVLWERAKPIEDVKLLYKSSGSSNSHNHNAVQHFFESYAALNGNLVKNQPKKAAAITKEWLKAAKWIDKNRGEAASIAVNNGYVSGSLEQNKDQISDFMWMPGVKAAKENVKVYFKELKEFGYIKNDTDEKEFVKKHFSDLIPDFGN